MCVFYAWTGFHFDYLKQSRCGCVLMYACIYLYICHNYVCAYVPLTCFWLWLLLASDFMLFFRITISDPWGILITVCHAFPVMWPVCLLSLVVIFMCVVHMFPPIYCFLPCCQAVLFVVSLTSYFRSRFKPMYIIIISNSGVRKSVMQE